MANAHKDSRKRRRYEVSSENYENLPLLMGWLQKNFPNDIKNNTDTINFALSFVIEYVLPLGIDNNYSVMDVIHQFKELKQQATNITVVRSLNRINETVEKVLLLELNNLNIESNLPPEVRANMIGPLREGSAGYIANQRLREISEAVKKRQINANKSGAMK